VTSIGNAWSYMPVSNALTGLSPGTTYHFMMFATNSVGVSNSADAAFTTASSPGPADIVPHLPSKPSAFPVTILGVFKRSNGTERIDLAGAPGETYVIEATDNLAASIWSVVGTNTASGSGQFSFTDSQSANAPSRFYRLRSQ
jgi:hypothetical protein